MRKIPLSLRNEIASDPFYKTCCLRSLGGCDGRIEFHHTHIYKGRQISEKFCILPVCYSHHNDIYFRTVLQLFAIMRATTEDLAKYPRFDWRQHQKWLITTENEFYIYLLGKGYAPPVKGQIINLNTMSEQKKEKKTSKFKKCKCGTETILFICPNCKTNLIKKK